MKPLLVIAVLWSLPLFAFAELQAISGLKFPNDPSEGLEPVQTMAWAFPDGTRHYPGFAELIPYVLRSPHQQEAGSCLYMSLTGVAEFWLSVLNPGSPPLPDGPLDLSERYLMNTAGVEEAHNGVNNWKTDSIFLLNNAPGMPRNVDYRFTKGWVRKDQSTNRYVHADPTSRLASYDTRYNWINEMHTVKQEQLNALPRFRREVLFADPASDQWNVGVMPDNIIEKIKEAIQIKRAPVHVIYNHYGYWHAVYIMGFDDDADTKQCRFVTRFIEFMQDKAIRLRQEAGLVKSPAGRERLLRQAEKAERTSHRTAQAMNNGGGCQSKGMFYVRDSLYEDKAGPVYDYNPRTTGEEANYAHTVILHEYDWVRYMANHATAIYLE